MDRLQTASLLRDLEKKMVFLVGPRQVGKTWLAREIGTRYERTVYLNYDNRADRDVIAKEAWLPGTGLLILDEIHKMKDWQRYLKGIFDTRPPGLRILVTGSARMDVLSRGGESLAGRYFRHRLLPFCPAEIAKTPLDGDLERLMSRGGFPEPLLGDTATDAERWRNQYADAMIRYDVLDFQRMIDFKALQLTFELLRERVGSPCSFASMARDIGVSPTTVTKYVQILEALFLVFRITPWSRNIARSLLKEPKIYFFDTGLVNAPGGARFENLTALSLLKYTWYQEDQRGESRQLHYLRTKDGAEVDFALVKKKSIERIIECKTSESTPDRNLISFAARYGFPATQLVQHLRTETTNKGVEVRRAASWLAGLPMA